MSNDLTSEELLLQKKADAYYVLQKKVHIAFNLPGKWKRGIINSVGKDQFLLDETLEGETVIFFSEIKDIRPYQEMGA